MGSKLLVTGNGFDLAHGLPTSYKDFLLFLRAITEFNPTKAEQERFDRADLFKELSDFVRKFLHEHFFSRAKYSNKREQIFDIQDNLQSEYSEYTGDNFWFTYFKQCSNQSRTNWIDFEQEIQRLVFTLESNTNNLHLTENQIHIKLPKYPSCDPSSSQVNSSEFAYCLYQDLTNFAFCFELYLKTVVEGVLNAYNPDGHFVSQLMRNISPDYVLTFNYTQTFERLYGDLVSTENIHHLHGEIGADASVPLSNLIFGFHCPDTMSDPHVSNFIWFEKYFQRILLDRGPAFYRWLHEHEQDLETVIYGHSLDITDRDILVSIIEKSRQTTIYYHAESAKADLVMNLVKLLTPERLAQYHADQKIVLLPAER